MNNNDKYMAEFAKELAKIDSTLGLNKKASNGTHKLEDVQELQKNNEEDPAVNHDSYEVRSLKIDDDNKKAKAELFNIMRNLVVLSSELESEGHSKAADLVDDVLNIISNDIQN